MYKVVAVNEKRYGIEDNNGKIIMTSLDRKELDERCQKWNELSKS